MNLSDIAETLSTITNDLRAANNAAAARFAATRTHTDYEWMAHRADEILVERYNTAIADAEGMSSLQDACEALTDCMAEITEILRAYEASDVKGIVNGTAALRRSLTRIIHRVYQERAYDQAAEEWDDAELDAQGQDRVYDEEDFR